MSLLVSGVFWDEVKVFSADNESSVHLGRDNGSGQDTATDGDETSEWALLVYNTQMLAFLPPTIWRLGAASASTSPVCESRRSCPPRRHLCPQAIVCTLLIQSAPDLEIPHTNIGSLNGGLWCPESQSNILIPSSSSLSDSAGLGLNLLVEEDVRLLLESAFALDSEFGGHGCGWRLSKSL